MSSSYTDTVYFSIVHALSFSLPLPPSHSPLKWSHCDKHVLYKHMYHVCVCAYVYLLGPSFTCERKYVTFVFLNLAYLT
jgi:hypothetical protein